MPGKKSSVSPPHDAIATMRRLEGIVASAMDGIITVNDRQEIVLFNPAAERMFGISVSEVLGQPISRFIPERYRGAHAAHIRRFAETGVTSRQMGALGAISGQRVDGEEFPIEASISQVEVGGERLSTVILRDITERQAAESALVESRRRMEGIVESAMDALVTVDEDQQIILFNPAAERMFGVPAAEAIGTPIERFIPERFRAGHGQHIRWFKEAGVTNRRMGALGAVSGLRASGEEFPVEASISHVHVGGARLATVILRDITERRANEEARLLLAREVDHRAKNALAVVQSVVSLTRAATTEEFVSAVRGRVSSLGRAHSLLAQNRWEGADLARVVTDETAPYQGAGQVYVSGQPVSLPPNAVQPISLLIHELATNAAKYGALSRDTGRVDVSWTVQPGGELRLEWREHGGPAVPATPANQGFGSTLIRELVRRQLHGEADLSWPASGLQLTLSLPAAAFRLEGPANGAAHAAASARTQRAGRLLLVEDEALIALALARDLGELGWEIIGPAGSVEEAMALVDGAELPDAAVLDINLDGRLVYPLADWLSTRQVPFVFCSGYEQLESNSRFETFPRLRKPVDIRLLDTTLRQVRAAA